MADHGDVDLGPATYSIYQTLDFRKVCRTLSFLSVLLHLRDSCFTQIQNIPRKQEVNLQQVKLDTIFFVFHGALYHSLPLLIMNVTSVQAGSR